MTEQVKKILWIIFAVALVATIALWSIFNPGPAHIEDTNGPDNFALQQITEEDVVSLKWAAEAVLLPRKPVGALRALRFPTVQNTAVANLRGCIVCIAPPLLKALTFTYI